MGRSPGKITAWATKSTPGQFKKITILWVIISDQNAIRYQLPERKKTVKTPHKHMEANQYTFK